MMTLNDELALILLGLPEFRYCQTNLNLNSGRPSKIKDDSNWFSDLEHCRSSTECIVCG